MASFDFGGAAGGAMGGAQMGSMFGPIGTGVGAVAGGLLGAFGKKKGKDAQVMQVMPQWMTQPGFEGATKTMAAYTNEGMQRLQAGQAPQWAEGLIGTQRNQAMDALRQGYWGGGGSQGPGQIQRSMEAASIAGAGPKAATAAARKSMWDYMQQSKQVEDQLSNMRYQAMAQEAQNLPTFIANRTQLGTPQLMNIPGQAASNPYASLLGNADVMKGGMGALSSMFKKPAVSPAGFDAFMPSF